jgi:DNA end-binding protein Ku
MPRAIWSGTISFGLVSIPVRLFNATSPRDVRFHQFDRQTGRRVRYRRVAEGEAEWPGEDAGAGSGWREPERASEAERESTRASEGARVEEGLTERPGTNVAFEDVVKGYEVDRDRFVMVSPEELEALRPEQSRTIEIQHFVNLDDIDPVFFEKSYYLAPHRGVGAEKPYALLLAAMERAGKVGIASFVLRSKEYLAAIRPVKGMLGLETLFFDDEVRTAEDVDNIPAMVDPPQRELDVAVRLIELLATDWDPSVYRDTYRERVLELIEGKLDAKEILEAETPQRAAPGVPDLMAALKASVEAAKKQTAPRDQPASKRPATSKSKARRRTG